uniref:small membrane A-kinase anchor protein n=1 Tax=Jaculus jaculus TaxID=51337 RepID=UPI0003334417|nr:small membrane A-kinase anchor protein [Jaculus jaculus]
MGCMKSKQTFPFPSTFETEKRHENEHTFMAEDRFLSRMLYPGTEQVQQEVPGSNPVIQKYAQNLAEEILHDALQQWASNHIKYCHIPYIENESPDAVGDGPCGAVGGAGASLKT